GDDAHIDFDFAIRTDAHESPLFEHPQQLDLQLDRHFGDLVEEQRAPIGALEVALVLADRAGKAALLVAEHLALDQLGRNRAAIDGNERILAAAAQVVKSL